MKSFLHGLADFFKALLQALKALPAYFLRIPAFLRGLWRAILRGFHRPPRDGCCLQLPPNTYVRPDPMIYDQYYLMSQGLAVTWDNPDIQLQDLLGNPVSGEGLTPNQDYRVVVQCWNNSYVAPAAGLLVKLSFLSFGIGITSTPIGATTTNLGVKASTHCPAYVDFVWRTPATPGHYCLQATLVWPDDANPNNNLGQKNTQVGALHSPAEFVVPVYNQASVPRQFEIEADMYALPELPSCSGQTAAQDKQDRYTESQMRWKAALSQQAYGMFPVTSAWQVSVSPSQFELGPDESTNITVAIEAVPGPFLATQSFNIHGFASPSAGPRMLAGGVTLHVQGS
jgi:hypothetical protein